MGQRLIWSVLFCALVGLGASTIQPATPAGAHWAGSTAQHSTLDLDTRDVATATTLTPGTPAPFSSVVPEYALAAGLLITAVALLGLRVHAHSTARYPRQR